MKPRTLLILLVLVLGLGAFIWFYERELPSSEERAEQSKRVLPVKKEDVRAVTIESAAGRVRLERVDTPKTDDEKEKEKAEDEQGDLETQPLDEAEWRIAQPLQARADLMAVDGMLDALIGLEKTRTLEDVAPADLGLDKPRATVRLATAKGEKVLQVGAPVPTGGSLVVGLGEKGKAYVVGDSFLSEIQKAPGDWRDRQLFHAQREEVRRVTLAGPAGKIVLARQGERFRIESPLADRADREKVDDLFADLSGLTAESFIDQPRPLADLGLAPPQGVVEVAVEGQQPVRIELGAPAAAPEEAPSDPAAEPAGQVVYARVGHQVIETRTRLPQAVARPAAEWRSLALTGFDVYEVQSATVRDAQGTLALERAGTDWKRGQETISYVPVSDLLFAVTGARAERLLSAEEARALGAGLGKPALTITLKPEKGAAETLTLFPVASQSVPARTSGRDAVLLLPGEKLQEIQKNVAEVRKAKPLPAQEKKEE